MYKIINEQHQLIHVIDEYNDNLFILLGRDRNLVIDLGMSKESIKPFLQQYHPYDIVCTHGHFDHVGRSNEFDYIYMSLKDRDLYLDNQKINNELEYIDIKQIKDIPSYFDLGDRKIYNIPLAGHSLGSYIMIDPSNHYIFTGDALGSGCGVWMQVDYALSIKEYHQSLLETYNILKEYHVDDTWLFFGGHAYQEYQSFVSSYNPLDLHLYEDMIILCEKLMNKEVELIISNARAFSKGQPYYARYQKAEMILTLSQLED